MDEFGRTKIFYTIVDGDEAGFQAELSSVENINLQDNNGMTLLHFAAEYSQTFMARQLIDRGIDLEIKDKYGNTALWKAVFNARGNYELVRLLAEHGADVDSLNNAGRSPLIMAETMGDEEMVSILSGQ